jgi:hypothetical protein
MTWKEIRSWAKAHGYECKKIDEGYSWQIDDSTNFSKSVSTLAKDIFNHMTKNQFVDHQVWYKENM